jgi:hypothetical protein
VHVRDVSAEGAPVVGVRALLCADEAGSDQGDYNERRRSCVLRSHRRSLIGDAQSRRDHYER